MARENGFTLVQFFTEYVLDGTHDGPIPEDAPAAPLWVYGASKAAGDLAVTALEWHHLARPTWVVGEGRNFVRTVLGLAARGRPVVVDDQAGPPTSAGDVADAVAPSARHRRRARHVQHHGWRHPVSRAGVAPEALGLAGRADLAVTGTTTAAFAAAGPTARPGPRTASST